MNEPSGCIRNGGGNVISIGEKVLLFGFIIGVTVFFIGAGIAIAWMVIEDTAFGRAIDEMMEERIERWRNTR